MPQPLRDPRPLSTTQAIKLNTERIPHSDNTHPIKPIQQDAIFGLPKLVVDVGDCTVRQPGGRSRWWSRSSRNGCRRTGVVDHVVAHLVRGGILGFLNVGDNTQSDRAKKAATVKDRPCQQRNGTNLLPIHLSLAVAIIGACTPLFQHDETRFVRQTTRRERQRG